MNRIDELIHALQVPPGKKISLKHDYDPGFTGEKLNKAEAEELLADGVQRLAGLQDKLYAHDSYAPLVILQALDAAGKDSTIKHVMSGVNPQGVEVHSFKAPSGEELDHDYLWRNFKALPRRGHIGIFNRSYYEEVLVVRVHPTFLDAQKLPSHLRGDDIWQRRFDEINHFEKYLVNNGFPVLKFFLNVSKEEQGRRFLERATRPEKNWKFSAADVEERGHWNAYMDAYQTMIRETASERAPWYVVPADNKWYTRIVVAAAIIDALASLELAYPTVSAKQKSVLQAARRALMAEKG